MTLARVFNELHPLIDVLGTLTFFVLVFGGTALAFLWFLKKTWKILVTTGVIITVLMIVQLTLGMS